MRESVGTFYEYERICVSPITTAPRSFLWRGLWMEKEERGRKGFYRPIPGCRPQFRPRARGRAACAVWIDGDEGPAPAVAGSGRTHRDRGDRHRPDRTRDTSSVRLDGSGPRFLLYARYGLAFSAGSQVGLAWVSRTWLIAVSLADPREYGVGVAIVSSLVLCLLISIPLGVILPVKLGSIDLRRDFVRRGRS